MAMALSSPKQPIQLLSTDLTVKNLHAMVKRCAASRNPSALGAWSIYAYHKVDTSPIDPREKSHDNSHDTSRDLSSRVADARFGIDLENLDNALHRLVFCLEEPYTNPPFLSFQPSVMLVFEGSHVLVGIKEMCEKGIADAWRLPAWLTGEDGATQGVVRNGSLYHS